jgi:hypothetical protein
MCAKPPMKKRSKKKHFKFGSEKDRFYKGYFGVDPERVGINKALSLIRDERRIVRTMRSLKGVLKCDKRPWPYL